MIREKRRSSRRPLFVDVFLHYPPLGMIRGTTCNVSREGMFVNTGGFTLPEGVELQISLRLEKGIYGTHRFRARVVHSRRDGVGVVLDEADQKALSALDRWLEKVA